ncbi:MAG: response regulator [Telluria sp.]
MKIQPPINILLVNSQLSIFPNLEAILADTGASLYRAASLQEALEQVLNHDFAVILLGLAPASHDGLDTAKRLREQPRSRAVPIIFLAPSGADDFPFEEAFALGAVDYLGEPVNPAVLRAKVSLFADLHGKTVRIAELEDAESERAGLLREVQAAGDRMTEIFAQAPAFMAVLSGPDHVFELVNEHFLQLVGKRELVGMKAKQVFPELEGQGFFDIVDKVYATGLPFFGTNLPIVLQRQPDAPPEERFMDLVYMALRDADGNITGILVHGVDQTHRALAEAAQAESQHQLLLASEELRASEERYRTLFESVDQGFCIIEMMLDPAGNPVDYRFLEMNRMFESQTGLVNVINKTARELVPDLSSFWFDTYGKVAITGEPVRFESEAKEMHRWFDVYAVRVGDPDSKKVALLFSDITARKQSEADLRRLAAEMSEADRRKTEFLATLAHELRNPLAPIRSGLGVLRLAGDNPEAVVRIREMMDRQVTQMVRLIDDLLDIARISGGKLDLQMERVDLKDVLSGAVETSLPLVEAGKHVLNLDITDHLLPVHVDVTRIGQVIANLLNNAAKYTPAGGRIDLSMKQDGDEAVISVADNGVGIPAESLASIFDMFSQVDRNLDRAQGGLGIGLSLVRRLVEMHGGAVTVESAGIAQGSTFTVRLPLEQAGTAGKVHGKDQVQRADGRHARNLRILVVDDNRDGAESLSAILELLGHTTRVAHDGILGMEAAREFSPDVVFLDIGMPGLNGYEVAQALRSTPGLEHIVLVALTGWGTENDRSRSQEAGFDYHLTKPAKLATVEALLAEL